MTTNEVMALVRPNIIKLSPYSTARDEYKGELGIFLDANENPNPGLWNRYPDPGQKVLKRKLSSIKGVPAANIFLGNGSDEAIDLLYRIFCEPGRDNAVAIAPSYGMYRVAADINDIEVREVALGENFSLPVEALLAAADGRTKLMFVCSPNNPSGNAFTREELLSLASRFKGILVVDEAYIDFSTIASLVSDISGYPNLVVLQTFSKARGLASLRLGQAFASEEVIRLMSMVKYPYNINGATQRLALAALDDSSLATQVKEIVAQREMLLAKLPSFKCVRKVYPSQANFILAEVDDADRMYDYLIADGIIVRNRNRVRGCEGCLRFTVGLPSENEALLQSLGNYENGVTEHSPASPSASASRTAEVVRKTKETDIRLYLDLEGGGESSVDSGLKFLDHMLSQLPHHGGMTLQLSCKGDLEVDEHHTMEDIGIALGDAFRTALGDKRGIERYGFCLPMDESAAAVLLDFGGRSELVWKVEFTREYVGDVPTEMFRHFFKSFCDAAKCNLRIEAEGENNHHIAESVFKAFARALKQAVRRDVFTYELPSSKGIL